MPRPGAVQYALIVAIAVVSVAAAFALQFADASPIDWRSAPTPHLLLLLALQLLPLTTLAMVTLDRRRR